MLNGNKGEWSEVYVLLKLLGDKKIYTGDDNFKKKCQMYFSILKIMREEIKGKKVDYIINDKIEIYLNGEFIKKIDANKFLLEAEELYVKIKNASESSFGTDRTEDFMKEILCSKIKPSIDKTDITMQIKDIHTGHDPILGFSIKSNLGKPATLLNAGKSTNFIFQVDGLNDNDIEQINSINTKEKTKDRMAKILSKSTNLSFVDMQSNVFKNNLMLIDSKLPEIIAEMLLVFYKGNNSECEHIINLLSNENKFNFPQQIFYNYKFKQLLVAIALGMTPAKSWNGRDQATGGYIIVTSCGDVLAYHVYNRNFFEDYLLKNTRFEKASTTRHGFACLYKKDGKIFINLNLQIRFK